MTIFQVRAGSLQELIYKHGQAGITKATVSITFDNRDRTQSPIGYENQDEIIVTRQVIAQSKKYTPIDEEIVLSHFKFNCQW